MGEPQILQLYHVTLTFRHNRQMPIRDVISGTLENAQSVKEQNASHSPSVAEILPTTLNPFSLRSWSLLKCLYSWKR